MTENNIKDILYSLGAEISYDDVDYMITNTVCHCGNKNKLYYYKESGMFYCYTNCGSMDIIELVKNHFEYEDDEFYKCLEYICNIANIEFRKQGFGNKKLKTISDFEFIRKYNKISKKTNEDINVKHIQVYNEDILKTFQSFYYDGWVNEGISINTMRKFEIKYCVAKQQIIIPHRNISNQLIGVRARNLLPESIETSGKYIPFNRGSFYYKHPLGENLYGLNLNINHIIKHKKIMLVEAEKSVMQTDTMFTGDNFTVALCGSNFTTIQRDIILNLILNHDVKEIIFALDKQYEKSDTEEYEKWIVKIKKMVDNLSTITKVSVILDNSNLLNYKDSPTDKGKDTFLKLYDTRIII